LLQAGQWERRDYSSKSEAIRDTLRDWVNPPVTLSDGTLNDLAESRRQRERGDTRSLDAVADDHDVHLNE
jgi:Arc/MetJ-type ribon-helix-helix transcriptional regulator